MKFTFLVTGDCFSSGVTGLLDSFTIANLWHQELTGSSENLFTTELVSIDGEPVASSDCIEFKAHKSITQTKGPKYVILPPLYPSPQLGKQIDKKLKSWLLDCHHDNIPIAAVCTGSFLLAETGLLNGRLATTNWQFARRFSRMFPRVKLRTEQVLTMDSNLICTGAATAHMDLALMLIKEYGSKELAEVCAKVLLVDPNRTSQAPYIFELSRPKQKDRVISKAQRFMEVNFADIKTIDEIAAHVGLSSRHFKRRFKQATEYSPLTYLQNIRIETAKQKLESTLDSVDEITQQIGYENASTFRRLFKNRTSLTPREHRNRFSKLR